MESSASDAAAAEGPVAAATAAAAASVRAAVALGRGSEENDRTLSLGTFIVRNGSALWVTQTLP